MDSRIADVLVWCIWSSNFEVRNWSNWTDCAADCEFIIAVVDLRWLHATAESSDTGLAKSKRSPDVPGLPKSTSTMYKKNQMGKALEMKKILEKWKAVGNPWAEHYVNTVNVSRCLNLPHFQVAYHLHRRHPPGLLQTSRRSLQGSGIFIGDFLRNLAFCILLSQIVRWFQAVWQIWDFKFSTLRELWASDNVKTKKTILNLRIQSDQPLSGPLTPYCGNGRVESWEDAISHLWFWIQMVSKSRLHKSSSVMDSFNDMPICPMAPETLGTTARPRSTLEKIPTDLCEC